MQPRPSCCLALAILACALTACQQVQHPAPADLKGISMSWPDTPEPAQRGAAAASLREMEFKLPVVATDTVELPPFKVLAEWITIQPMLLNDRVRYVSITGVTRGSPAAKAGLRPGLLLVAIQGVVFRGLTPAEFQHELETMKQGDWIELGIADPPRPIPDERKNFRVVRFPARKATQTSVPQRAPDPARP